MVGYGSYFVSKVSSFCALNCLLQGKETRLSTNWKWRALEGATLKSLTAAAVFVGHMISVTDVWQ